MNLKTVLLALLLAVAGLSWIWALQGQRESVRAAEALDEAEEKSRLFRETVRRLAEDEEAQRHARTTATDVLAEWRVLLGDGLLAVLERVESHADRTGIEVDDVVQAPGDKAERLTWNVTGPRERPGLLAGDAHGPGAPAGRWPVLRPRRDHVPTRRRQGPVSARR